MNYDLVRKLTDENFRNSSGFLELRIQRLGCCGGEDMKLAAIPHEIKRFSRFCGFA
jgi:hypothetical protein